MRLGRGRDAGVHAPLPFHGILGHRLHPGRDADVVVSSLDGGGDVGDGLQAGGALAIHGANGNLLREAGEEHGYATLVGALGGVAEDGTDDDVADVGRVQTGRGDGRLEKGGEEVIRGGVLETALLGARDGGAQRAHNDDVVGGLTLEGEGKEM